MNHETDKEVFERILAGIPTGSFKVEPLTYTEREIQYKSAAFIRRKYSNGKVKFYYRGYPDFDNKNGYSDKEILFKHVSVFLLSRYRKAYLESR